MTKLSTQQQLDHALEGLEQINKSHEDGDYLDTLDYIRDIKAQTIGIERLEKKLAKEQDWFANSQVGLQGGDYPPGYDGSLDS